MTAGSSEEEPAPAEALEPASPLPARGPRLTPRRWFADRPIGAKLTIGLGSMVALTLIVVGIGLIGGARATASIDQTVDRRAPTALASARAQASMLRMVGDVRGYLALGDPALRDSYHAAASEFEAALAELGALAARTPASDPYAGTLRGSLASLEASYADWKDVPEELFAIRDDQLKREPALRILIEDATPQISLILQGVGEVARVQRLRTPTTQNLEILDELASFETAFLSEVSGLRGYVTTGRQLFKFEYDSNRTITERAWTAIEARRDAFDVAQVETLDGVAEARTTLLPMPLSMFAIVEGDRSREDLFQFRVQALPLADLMVTTLDRVANAEQDLLSQDLAEGRSGLSAAQTQSLIAGVAAILLGVLLAAAITRATAGPVQRLTQTAERIGAGDLALRAQIESRDEIGTLATTFNAMTGRLAETISTQQEYIREVGHVTDAAVAVEADAFQPGTLAVVSRRHDALGALARTFERMATEVKAREERLRAQVRELRIEIDEARQAKKVSEITDTDYFRSLRGRAMDLRKIVGGDRGDPSEEPPARSES